MKNILVPTDYSSAANNALQYAIELAKKTGANLVLVHAYHIPVPTTEVPVLVISPLELSEENERRMKRLENEVISGTDKKIKVKTIVRPGFPADVIIEESIDKKADLIVMGITGKGDKAGEPLLGSIATAVMKRSLIPVLTVPKGTEFREIRKIALAYDYEREMKHSVLLELKNYVKLFQAELLVVDVINPVEVPSMENAVAGIKLERSLEDVHHSLHFPASDDIIAEINSFVDTHNCDLLVMVPHKHKLLSAIFHKSNTRKMAFHTHLPLLTFHD